MKITGARILLETLKREGVTDIFGYPGGKVIPIYNELFDFNGINHIMARHEQGASHAADGYARTTNKTGVCISTSGPGATNLVTGIMTAHMDSVPLLAITGQVACNEIGTDGFQESDIMAITMPITKYSYLVTDINDLTRIVKEALYISKNGRPGPVLIDFPVDIQMQEIDFKEFEKQYSNSNFHIEKEIDISKLNDVIEIINSCEKPLILAGGGAKHSKQELKNFAEKISSPIAFTLMGLGTLNNDLSLGMLGMHGSVVANKAVSQADVIIAVGMRFDDRVTCNVKTFAPKAKIIHIDIDKVEINKIKKCTHLVGDATEILTLLTPYVDRKYSCWNEHISKLKSETCFNYETSDFIKPQQAIDVISKLLPDAYVVTDVGQHQMWTAQFYNLNHPLCTSGGGGTMGFGLPAAMGAQIGNPNSKVVAILGDGGFQMTSQELMAISQYKLPIKIVIIDNSYLGMVRQWQELFFDKRYSSVNLDENPDFVSLGKAYNIKSIKIEDPKELEDTLRKNLFTDEAILIDIKVAREENTYPMVPANGNINEMILGG
ncbi:biosynthetic-type acetolactate synthase large subunit [Fusobacterium sp. MFO224]|uniref:biosynthetic-type acetolactate synthase large subunit n=1 Tax=Fusobacterium sp. MFO224 TaxID=3378070 RepID=UPI003852210E